ncbi:MAG: tetratricopeptide repeat protein [Chlorobi bacterium]|nr:tetratricopeptide repeat protein [Chlorobiota bacterium]
MTKKILYIFIFLFASNLIFSQNNTGNEISLAYEYYRSKDYDKAEVLFKKIFEKTHAKIYFTYYANCLIEQSKFDIAEKEIKKQIRKNKNDITYYVDLGYLFKKHNDTEQAKKYFEKALKKLRSNPSQVRAVASAFIQRQEYDNAEKAYIIGKQTTGKRFRNELANLYAIQRKYDKMIDQYLSMLEYNSRNITLVQNRLQYFLKKDVNDEFANTLQTELIKRIQKPKSGIVYNQMLIWHYMQRKEFGKALFQQMAIDKRLHSSGKKVLELAEIAKENNDLVTATTAYKYVIDKGENMPYFVDAKLGYLNVNFLKVKKGIITDNEKLLKLEKEYERALIKFGINSKTLKAIIDLSHLQAFYLNKPKAAEDLLTDAIKIKGLDKKLATKCKIELGDILVFENDLDYAALIYGQAEMDNKGNSLGDIAKLKKAKLAYFANNFKWAKAQFDALKASTSKPVANDALYYSIHISENTEDDSLQLALKTFAKAELLVFRHKTDSAIILLDTLISKNVGHQIIDDAIFLKAKIYEQNNDFINAEKFYKKVMTEYSWDILADLATYRLAIMYEEKLNNKEEAAEYYKKLMLEHPDSIYVSDARRRFRKIRDGM